MERLERILSVVDRSLNTKKRRHITGGVLMSVSLLFGGLALTVLTLKIDGNEVIDMIEDEDDIYLD